MYPELVKYQDIETKRGLQFINLGTGMGYYDFNYENIPVSAFNFALPQQSLQFDYNILENYYHQFERNCKIGIVLSYCVFCANYFDELGKVYERYYSILPQSKVKDYSKSTYDQYKEKLSREGIGGVLELTKVLNMDEMNTQSDETINIWIKQLKIISCTSGIVSSHAQNEICKAKKWLEKILVFCKEKDFEPIIIVPPMSEVLLDKISHEFRKSHFYNVLEEVVDSDITILDYSDNERFCNPCLYGWPGFLVKNAAREFTWDVLNRVGVVY